MGEGEVWKQRITTQLKSAVKALQAAHVRDRASVVYRLAVVSVSHYLLPSLAFRVYYTVRQVVVWCSG